MRKSLLFTVAFVAFAGEGFAADLPSIKSPPIYAPAPVFSWTGFYVGVQLGGDFGTTSAFAPAIPYGVNAPNNGVFGGGHVGYNYQINNFVIGLQGEFNGSSASASRTDATTFAPAVLTLKANQGWFGSIDGRLGFAVDRTLFYAIGGVAFTENEGSAYVNGVRAGGLSNSRTGYDIGAGVEYAFTNNWTARLEYRYYDYGSATYVGNLATYRERLNDSTVRVGLTYKFGAPDAVVARY